MQTSSSNIQDPEKIQISKINPAAFAGLSWDLELGSWDFVLPTGTKDYS